MGIRRINRAFLTPAVKKERRHSFSEWGMLSATFSAASGMFTQATLSWMQRQPKNLEARVKLLPA
jgi:hypothetical protein